MPSPALPQQIHRYQILSELGRGSTGKVFLARDPLIDRRIALKILMLERLRGDVEETRRRFEREARAAGGLSHRGIVTVYDAGTDAETGTLYLAMEWVPGCSLKALLRREGRLGMLQAVEMAARVARALAYAHRREVVHRDVKPANLLVTGDGEVKIVDFGIARLLSQSVTLPGRVLGSPYYMAPEQVAGHTADGRADLFALGSVLFETLTGRRAFAGETVAAVTHNILNADPPPIERLRPEVPPSLQAVVRRALAKLPADRFASGAELAAALETVAAELVLGQAPGTASRSLLQRRGCDTRALSASTEVLQSSASASLHVPVPAPRRALRPAILAALVLAGILIGRWPARLATPEAELLVMDSRSLERSPRPPPTHEARKQKSPAAPTPQEVELEESTRPAPGTEGGEPDAPTKRLEPKVVVPAPGRPWSVPEVQARGSAFWPSPALLEIVHESRLRHAVLSVRIDGETALSVELRTKNLLTRVAGRQHRWTIPVTAGQRTLEVRVSGVSKPFEARKEVSAIFSAAEGRRLRIEVQPGSQDLTLAWLE